LFLSGALKLLDQVGVRVKYKINKIDLKLCGKSPIILCFLEDIYSRLAIFFFAFFIFFSLSFSRHTKMSSSGKDTTKNTDDDDDDDVRRRFSKKKATTTTTTLTTKDALERALSRREKYVSSSKGRFAEDLGTTSELELQTQTLSFSLSLLRRTDSISSLFKAENRKDATKKVAKLTSALVSGINRGVLEVFENQKEVEKEAKLLQKKVETFKNESRTWVESLNDFDESVKSIGDFENYVMTLENELKGIAEELKKRKE
tara:strand:- start:72 stop:848 length:777 start_codon:yes stop_codon:yes gene_type:complete